MPSTRIKAALKESWALDLTRWSNDPKVSNAVDTIAADLQSLPSFTRITNNRKRALRVLILNLYLRWLEAPSGSLAYSRNKNNYTIPERYNPSKIGYRSTKSVVDGLAVLGYVNKLATGFYSRTGGKSRMSRMAATNKLIDTLEQTHGVDGSMIDVHSRSETIILRKKDKNNKQRDVGYNDTKLTKSRRNLLQDYNRLLRSKYIDIDLQGHPDPVRINLANKFVRRIFSNRSFKQGGRYYGGWWQTVPRELRPRILIKTKPTVELDFSGNQVMTAYAEMGIDYFNSGKGDPYILPNYGSQHRELFKKVMLVVIVST